LRKGKNAGKDENERGKRKENSKRQRRERSKGWVKVRRELRNEH
jgi:hypothetical protein